jgi:hypothetical protein
MDLITSKVTVHRMTACLLVESKSVILEGEAAKSLILQAIE